MSEPTLLSAETAGRLESRFEGSGDARRHIIVLHTPKGDLTKVVRAPENKPGMAIKPYIELDADIEKYLSIPYEPPELDLTPVRAFYETAGDRGLMFVTYREPMYGTASLFDFEDFAVRCITDMPSFKRLVDWSFERCAANLRLLVAACRGMECVMHTGGPEICTPPMMPPSVFAELVTPYMKKLIEIIHDGGLLAGIHCHGRVREVLPEIMATSCDVLEPIEPPDQGNITLAELFEQVDGRMCLMGHIQDQGFYTAPPGHMTRRVEEIARVAQGRTGYIMTPTCTPFEHPCSETFRRNYLEWLDAGVRLLGTG